MGLAFTGALGQLVGMGAGIYIVWDWNTVEPWTWTFCKFNICFNLFL